MTLSTEFVLPELFRNVPDRWTIEPLRNIAKFTTGWTPPTSDDSSYDGKQLWANISDLKTKFIGETAKTISNAAVLVSRIAVSPVGSLLFSFKLSVGQVAIVSRNMYTNEAIATFKDTKRLSVPFGYYALPIWLVQNANENIYGAKLLNAQLMRSARVAVPPLDEQRQIAEYLDRETGKIDELITKQEQLVATLTERRSAQIYSAVTTGINPSVNSRDTGCSEIGRIPAHWNTRQLKHIILSQTSGTSVLAADTPAGAGHVGVLKTSSVSTGVFKSGENKTVSDEELSRVTCPVRGGTILINRANSPAYVGAAAFVETSEPNLYLSDKLWQIVVHEGDARFVSWWMQTRRYRDQVGFQIVGASLSMQNLSYEAFRGIRLAWPPLQEQRAIAAFLAVATSKIDDLAQKAKQTASVLRERRAALINAAVTGKIDVRGL